MKNFLEFLNENRKTSQDQDLKDKEGTQPKKYYSGLSKSTKEKRNKHFKDKKDGFAPGDKNAKTKPSKHTKKYKDMFGESVNPAVKKKAEKSGISSSILQQVYNRGIAAYKTGHRPGTTPEQWALARVNSFITGGKTRTTADSDLWAKVKK